MSLTSLLLTAALALTGPGAAPAGSIIVPDAGVLVIKEVDVAAEEAGVLRRVEIDYGHEIESGQFLAQIADEEAQSQVKIAQRELEVATERATNQINVTFAQKSFQVTSHLYKMAWDVNQREPSTVAQAEMVQKRFEAERAKLSIEQAQQDLTIAAIEQAAAQVKLEAAQEALQRRKIVSPVSGEMVQLYREAGEWVNPGDPICRLIQLDRVRVEVFVDPTRFTRPDLVGSEVTFTVSLPGGDASFSGKVTYVSPEIDARGYQVWAEVINRRDRGQWQLTPEMTGEMAIKLSTVASRTGDRPRATPMPGPNLR